MRIEKGQVYKLNKDLILNEVLYVDGELNLDPTTNATLTTTKNIIVTGKITGDLRNAPDITKRIYFKDVNMSRFVGGGFEPIDSDVGLWFMGAGYAEIYGAHKTEYTTALGSIPAGARSVPVNEKQGWRMGDKIVIWSGDVKPQLGSRYFDSATKKYLDSYAECMERRTITGFDGSQVLFDEPLRFKHEVFTTEGNKLTGTRTHYPYIVNETRNIKIYGADGKRSHIFACAHSKNPDGSTAHNIQKHTIKDVEVFYMGVRKSQPGGAGYVKGIDDVVTGRYALHFHHAGDGTNGSVIESCSFHDNGGRCFVPHLANGIAFIKNSITFNLGDAMWWDFGEMSHNSNWHKNMLVGVLWDGVQLGGTAILLGIGDNNSCTDNILMYSNQGDVDGSGAIQWTADNEGVWLTRGNLIYCCHNADWTWQNSGRGHEIKDQTAVNCVFGLTHGAYGNLYIYNDCQFYNSPVKVRASGPTFQRCVFDGMGRVPELVYAQTSAVGGSDNFRECEFKNAPTAVILDVYPHNEENATPRTIELVNNTYVNVNRKYQIVRSNGGSYPGIVPNCAIYTQEGNAAKKITPMATETTIAKFAPDKYGKGDGLRTEIFRGMNFETKVQDHVRVLVREDDWRIDLPKMPNGANYKFIMPDKVNQYPFSFRYTGQVEAYYTGAHRFRLYGGSGFRLWIADKLVIDAPGNKHDNSEYVDSPSINLTAGVKVNIKVEVYEPGDRNMGIKLQWQGPGFGWRDVETSQLYSGAAPLPPDPTVYKNVRMEKEFTRNNCPAGYTGGKFIFIVAAGMFTSIISQADADAKATAYMNVEGQKQANIQGACTPPVVELKANAGPDQIITGPTGYVDGSASTGAWTRVNWTRDSGPGAWDPSDQNNIKTAIKAMQPGAHVIKLRLTDAAGKFSEDRVTINVVPPVPPSFTNKAQTGTHTCIDGTVLTHTVPAGKYTAITQATADAMAIQELNTELAKCPAPWFTATLPSGKTLYLFGTEENPKIIIK